MSYEPKDVEIEVQRGDTSRIPFPTMRWKAKVVERDGRMAIPYVMEWGMTKERAIRNARREWHRRNAAEWTKERVAL